MGRVVKRFAVRLTANARGDLSGIGEYIEASVSRERALQVMRSLRSVMATLSEMPSRGAVVNEARDIGLAGFREIHFKPYRIIYEVTDDAVVVHMIADGRRNMRAMLLHRLLRA